MATMEEKKLRQLRLFNNIIYGFASGLYGLFGDTALATMNDIGAGVLRDMENELGLEIAGEDPEDILMEIERLLIDEYGLVDDVEFNKEGDEVYMTCQGCLLWKATESLQEDDIPPYTCAPMMMASTALRKRLGVKRKFVSLDQETDKHICNIHFQLME